MKCAGRMIALALSINSAMQPAAASTIKIQANGLIDYVEGEVPGADVKIGDQISVRFVVDLSKAAFAASNSIGGGIYTNYDLPLTGLQLAIGSYVVKSPTYAGHLVFMDNSFGSDGLVFLLSGLTGGPFESIFGNAQLQARGSDAVLNSSGIGNGLPLDDMDHRFFMSFGGPSGSKRVFGTLLITAPAVPELATWLTFLAGLGMCGAALRRKSLAASVMADALRSSRKSGTTNGLPLIARGVPIKHADFG